MFVVHVIFAHKVLITLPAPPTVMLGQVKIGHVSVAVPLT